MKVCLLLSELSNTDNIRSVRLRSNQANFSRKSNFLLLIYREMIVCGKEGENNIPVSCVVILERDGIVKVGFGYQNCRRIFFPCAIDYRSWPYWSRNPVKRTLSRRLNLIVMMVNIFHSILVFYVESIFHADEIHEYFFSS